MSKSPRAMRPALVVLFLLVCMVALTSEVLQHVSLARWAGLLLWLGLDPTDTFVLIRDLIRFRGSDMFGAAGYVLWASRSEDASLPSIASSVGVALLGLELVQMMLRGPFDWFDMLAYTLGISLAVFSIWALGGRAHRPGAETRVESGTDDSHREIYLP